MPRVYLKRHESQDRELMALLDAHKIKCNLSNDDLAEGLGLGRSTFYNRRTDPSTFTLGELRSLRQRLRIPKEEMPLPGDN